MQCIVLRKTCIFIRWLVVKILIKQKDKLSFLLWYNYILFTEFQMVKCQKQCHKGVNSQKYPCLRQSHKLQFSWQISGPSQIHFPQQTRETSPEIYPSLAWNDPWYGDPTNTRKNVMQLDSRNIWFKHTVCILQRVWTRLFTTFTTL